MPKYELVSSGGDYAPVADRITLFYSLYPNGRILTRIVSRTAEDITVEASVYRSFEEPGPAATGLASERFDDGEVNAVACLENTETSAIGRALANLGLTASSQRPSREEMEKAACGRARRVAEAVRAGPSGSTRHARSLTRSTAIAGPALQRRADRVMDALELLGRAERAGLAPARARKLRIALTEPGASVATIERIERHLRAWTTVRHEARVGL